MPKTAPRKRRKPSADRDHRDLRKRVGAYVRARREELGLSQGDIISTLGYVSRNSVSNVETGREGLPAKRVHAWADVLHLPHEAFFRFVLGETKRVESGASGARRDAGDAELCAIFQKLPPRLKKRAEDLIRELAAEAKAEQTLRGGVSNSSANGGGRPRPPRGRPHDPGRVRAPPRPGRRGRRPRRRFHVLPRARGDLRRRRR